MSDFRIVGRETTYRSRVFDVESRQIEHDGEIITREVALHRGAVAMLAVDSLGRVGLIEQYRSTFDRSCWEIPAGTIDATDNDPLSTAQRELVEELGMQATTWSLIGCFMTSPGWTTQIMHIYLATGLTYVGRHPEGPEETASRTAWLSLSEIDELIAGQDAFDATATIALGHLRLHGHAH